MNPGRRKMLCSMAGAAVLWQAAAAAGAQTAAERGLRRRELSAPRLRVDGAAVPVRLAAVRIDTEISGRMALTQVEFEFFNPNARILEGELQFPLLEGQSVVGMAMEVEGGVMREAVAVDKARGEQVFEDVTRARIDPALLSATEGNGHKLRVYPIPANGPKRVMIRYAEALAARDDGLVYRLPLGYSERMGERVGELAVTIRTSGGAGMPRLSQQPWQSSRFVAAEGGYRFAGTMRDADPQGWLEVAFGAARQASVAVGEHDGRRYFVAQIPASRERRVRSLPKVVQLVWDASGSGAARDHAREFALLDAYFARSREIDVRLIRLRDAAEPAQRFIVSGGDWSALRRELESTAYDGATAFGALTHESAAGEVLLFSDGLANYGDKPWLPPRVPVYVISAAERCDAARCRAIAGAASGAVSGGDYIDLLALTPAEARNRLLERPLRLAALQAQGARELVSPTPVAEAGWFTVAGELTEPRATLQLAIEQPGGRRRVMEVPIDSAADHPSALAAQAWAGWQIAALQIDEERHRGEIRRLSREFAIVSRETSLIILDRAEDYARHEITPPPELAERVAQLRNAAAQAGKRSRQAQIDRVARLFEHKQAWWEREFPKEGRRAQIAQKREATLADAAMELARRRADGPPPAAPAPVLSQAAPAAAPARVAAAAPRAESKDLMASGQAGRAGGEAPAVIRLQPAQIDPAYGRRMRAAPAGELYRVYLDERKAHARSTGFFLDAADLMFERGQAALALRVLSNLAEMDLENRALLRILGQRLLQAQAPALAVPVLRKVLRLAPHEPQSYRDLGLALAASGQAQAAIEMLHEVVQRPWPRFPEIELIALAELNAIVAARAHGTPLDTSAIDRRLLRNLPLDLRAVLSWDTDNTDVDLWVTDPDGEAAYYGNALTYQGGRMSQDATGGYGPEEFALRHAKPGVYRVEAQFYGHRQQIVSAATTIQLVLSTGFGTARQADRRVTLRLREPKDRVFVGEFEVGAGGLLVGSR